MSRLRFLALAGLAAAGALVGSAEAGGPRPRTVVGGHPYHNGNFAVPPSSAYEATRVFPPMRYGFPAYYMPQSYLPPGMAVQYQQYPGWPQYGYGYGTGQAPYGTFGQGYYMPAAAYGQFPR